jgi:hypothetical protein
MGRTCNESAETCSDAPAADGTSCDDGRWCSGADTCSGGECQHAYPCPLYTGNPCTRADCDEALHCVEIPLMDGESCVDPNPCTFFATCGSGTCTQRDSRCADSVPCSTDFCATAGDGVCRTVATCP